MGVEIVEVIVLGSGTSEGVPRVSCLTSPDALHALQSNEQAALKKSTNVYSELLKNAKTEAEAEDMNSFCRVCIKAASGDKNKRRNTCLLIRIKNDAINKDRLLNIIIDCGKFFWQSAMEFFPKFGIRFIDAILISHGHNDACYGLDDLRDWTLHIPNHPKLPIYLREKDKEVLQGAYPYIFTPPTQKIGGGVSELEFVYLKDNQKQVQVLGLNFDLHTVKHGHNGCLAFKFNNVIWMSDIAIFTQPDREFIEGCQLLFVDGLNRFFSHPSHISIDEAMEEIRRLKKRPEMVYYVGMNHMVDHELTNEYLDDHSPFEAELAYDGLVVKDTKLLNSHQKDQNTKL